MKIRVLGGGWYGCHISATLLADGHDVELHEIAGELFAGASGANPARLHGGFHYPRSRLTRALCQEHHAAFMACYGALTRGVPVNIYAIAAEDSLVDFGTYCEILAGETQFVAIERPAEFGLDHVEGAVLTGERHIVIERARAHFSRLLEGHVRFGVAPGGDDDAAWDWTIDCTFCALDGRDVDRYEPCLMVLLRGPTDRAVTIMDGPFPSLYPWHEESGLSSLTSARWTPFSKSCRSREAARAMLDSVTLDEINHRAECMLASMARFYPAVREEYEIADHKLSIRAMPRSGADARLVDIARTGERSLRVRAGKIDAILLAEREIKRLLSSLSESF